MSKSTIDRSPAYETSRSDGSGDRPDLKRRRLTKERHAYNLQYIVERVVDQNLMAGPEGRGNPKNWSDEENELHDGDNDLLHIAIARANHRQAERQAGRKCQTQEERGYD